MKTLLILILIITSVSSSELYNQINREFEELDNFEIKLTTVQEKPKLKRESKEIDLEELFFSSKKIKSHVYRDKLTTGQSGTRKRIRER